MVLLIVEDNLGMRRLIKSLVADLAEIIECADGCDALAADDDEHHPDCVLMDIEMKRMDGLTATAALTAAHPDARVHIVTNYDSNGLREEARRAGACDDVLKENLFALQQRLQAAA